MIMFGVEGQRTEQQSPDVYVYVCIFPYDSTVQIYRYDVLYSLHLHAPDCSLPVHALRLLFRQTMFCTLYCRCHAGLQFSAWSLTTADFAEVVAESRSTLQGQLRCLATRLSTRTQETRKAAPPDASCPREGLFGSYTSFFYSGSLVMSHYHMHHMRSNMTPFF